MSVIITGYGYYVPKKILSNHDLSAVVDTDDNWIYTRTGIRNRHIIEEGQHTSDMAAMALKQASVNSGIDILTIDGVILATTTPDDIFPATAARVQEKVGLAGRGGFAFDIQAVCSGFLYALSVARALIMNKSAKRIAVIGADSMSKILDWTDRSTCVLFGDGAGAVIIEDEITEQISGNNLRIRVIDDILVTDGGLYNILKTNESGKVTMDGKDVFKHAVEQMSSMVLQILAKNGLTIDDISWLLPHQANSRIIKAVGEKIGLADGKEINVIENYANTSAASIPIALAASANKWSAGEKIIMVSAGAGMSFGVTLIQYI